MQYPPMEDPYRLDTDRDELVTDYDLADDPDLEDTALSSADRELLDDLDDILVDDTVEHLYLGGSSVDEQGYDDIDLFLRFDDDIEGIEKVEQYQEVKERVEEADTVIHDEDVHVSGVYGKVTGLTSARLQFTYFGVSHGTPHAARFDVSF